GRKVWRGVGSLLAAGGGGCVVVRGKERLVGTGAAVYSVIDRKLGGRVGGGGGGGGGGSHRWANICDPPRSSTAGSAAAALQLEQVVQLGQHQQEPQLLVRPAQAHRQPALRRLALDQHQRPEARAIDLPGGRQIDHQAPGPF